MDSGIYKTKECTCKKNEMSNVEKSDIEGDGDPFLMPYLNYNYYNYRWHHANLRKDNSRQKTKILQFTSIL